MLNRERGGLGLGVVKIQRPYVTTRPFSWAKKIGEGAENGGLQINYYNYYFEIRPRLNDFNPVQLEKRRVGTHSRGGWLKHN